MKAAFFALLILLSAMLLRTAQGSEKKVFDLTTLLGETYHGCRIIKVTPEALTIVHDTGVSKVPFELLGDSWRELYHYDADKAREFAIHEDEKRQEAEAKRQKAQQAYERDQTKLMDDLAKSEKQRQDLEAKLASEQAKASAPAPPLAPYPADPSATPWPTIIVNNGVGVPQSYSVSGGYPATNVYPYSYVPTYVYPQAGRPPGARFGPRGRFFGR